ncbi:hypothetical protein Pyn_11067 [Prunus yedoensis var. nudiflora]|uniref:Uncharacterized protein n=1 Tax=Prunus yedoensis var. nudiflora TaxID=2094558 RepID=A0A314Z8L8_PRUYE|nr:hypothetical protein Pyn_11067 [Prunus yedoensis var. nudiflora]
MGDVISKAADGVGGLLEKAFLAPFKNMFGGSCDRKQKSLSRRRKDKLQRSFYPSSRHGTHSHHHVKSRGRSVRVVGRSRRLRSSRHLQSRKVRNVRTQARTSKRRKL